MWTRRGGGGGGGGGAAAPLEFFKWPILGKRACNIQTKPPDFRASNGENIWAAPQQTSAPPPP